MLEASAGPAAAQEISLDTAVGGVLSELGSIFTVKVEQKTALKAFYRWTILYSRLSLQH